MFSSPYRLLLLVSTLDADDVVSVPGDLDAEVSLAAGTAL
jgi:hypothetical protein